jgi:predicted amidophosphoribosyltransferase
MADILADFVQDETPLLNSADAIVPIPAAPGKYVARGFAPNDLVAQRISQRLALPVYDVLRRRDGNDTLHATYQDLADQFTADAARARRLRGLTIILVEDIWTKAGQFRSAQESYVPSLPPESPL